MKPLIAPLLMFCFFSLHVIAGPSEFWNMDAKEAQALEVQRHRVYKTAEMKYGISKFNGTKSDLYILQTLINDKAFPIENKIGLQALGVVFGDVLARDFGLKWVMVRDQYGTDPTLRMEGTNYQFNALTMISKRLEEGKKVNVFKLYDQVAQYVKKIRDQEARRAQE